MKLVFKSSPNFPTSSKPSANFTLLVEILMTWWTRFKFCTKNKMNLETLK